MHILDEIKPYLRKPPRADILCETYACTHSPPLARLFVCHSHARGGEKHTAFRPWSECSSEAMRVERRDGETVDQLLRRFNKVVVAERITKTFREKMHFVSKSEQRKEKARRAERNRRKRALQAR